MSKATYMWGELSDNVAGGVPAQPCWKWDKARKRFVRDYSQPGCERTKPPKKPNRPPIEEIDKKVIE